MASWYGDDFHGRLTANGEVFDMNALSAAHPTLPMPSYVRVTNLSNKKSIIVRVNDRGPYHGNRVIDLSHKTADLLGFKGNGVARVRVDYVGRASLDGSDDRKLIATLREGEPAPAPSAVRIASAKPFVDLSENQLPACCAAPCRCRRSGLTRSGRITPQAMADRRAATDVSATRICPRANPTLSPRRIGLCRRDRAAPAAFCQRPRACTEPCRRHRKTRLYWLSVLPLAENPPFQADLTDLLMEQGVRSQAFFGSMAAAAYLLAAQSVFAAGGGMATATKKDDSGFQSGAPTRS